MSAIPVGIMLVYAVIQMYIASTKKDTTNILYFGFLGVIASLSLIVIQLQAIRSKK